MHHLDHVTAAIVGAQNLTDQRFRPGVAATQQNMIGAGEGLERHAFLQGIWQTDHRHIGPGARQTVRQLFAAAHWKHALVDQQPAARQRSNTIHQRLGLLEFARLQRQKHHRGRLQRGLIENVVAQPAAVALAAHQLGQPRLLVR